MVDDEDENQKAVQFVTDNDRDDDHNVDNDLSQEMLVKESSKDAFSYGGGAPGVANVGVIGDELHIKVAMDKQHSLSKAKDTTTLGAESKQTNYLNHNLQSHLANKEPMPAATENSLINLNKDLITFTKTNYSPRDPTEPLSAELPFKRAGDSKGRRKTF